MPHPDVPRQRTKQRNPAAEEHRNSRDDQTLNETRFQKPLDRHASVDIEISHSTLGKPSYDLPWRAGHRFTHGALRRNDPRWCAAQDDDRFGTIRPLRKAQHRLEGLAADDERVDRRDELVVAVIFDVATRQPVERAVLTRDEAVEARRDEDGSSDRTFHG